MPKRSRVQPRRQPPVTPAPSPHRPGFDPPIFFNPDRELDTSQVSDQRNAIKKEIGFAPIPPWVMGPINRKTQGRPSKTKRRGG